MGYRRRLLTYFQISYDRNVIGSERVNHPGALSLNPIGPPREDVIDPLRGFIRGVTESFTGSTTVNPGVVKSMHASIETFGPWGGR